jgi:hypothetical protein
MMKKIWPPLVLFLLAPVIGELLSGYTPPSEFFSPLPFFALAVLYGGGVLLIREITVRKGWGWYSTVLLGIAFVIIKEGFIKKSLYDPLWQDIGILGYYGRWAGINWIWSIEVVIYLAIVGVTVPILLTELTFPSVRRESWLGRGVITVVIICFIGSVIFGNIFLSEYSIGVIIYLLDIVAIVALVIAAWWLSRWQKTPSVVETTTFKNPLLFWLVGFTAMICFVAIFWVLPEFIVLPLVIVILAVLMLSGYFWLVRRLTGNFTDWADIHQLALASGPLTFLIILAPLLEINPNYVNDPVRMTTVSAIAFLLLMLLFWKTIKRMGVAENG